MSLPSVVGVIGAGTMGAGIAQVAAQAGARTLLHDPLPEALERGVAKTRRALERLVEKGRLGAEEARAAVARIEAVPALEDLAGSQLIIEAAPERMALKLELFGALSRVVSDDCVLATNTSSLSITAIAAAASHPERVVGMHFFNPVPLMPLLEVIAAEQSGGAALAAARAAGEAMGKRVIDAPDVAGFLVNRCNRPYSLESLKLLEDGLAAPAEIDAAMRGAAGFRMGPFELMDLVGIDTNHLVAEAMWSAEYGEPRYRPSSLAARMVAAGRLGRKTGRGWYTYGEDGPPRSAAAPQAAATTERLPGPVAVRGRGPVPDALREALGEARGEGSAWFTLDCGGEGPVDGPVARLLWDGSLHATGPRAVGFYLLLPLEDARVVEYTVTDETDARAVERFELVMRSIGREPLPVGDAPGLISGRVVCQLINEAHFMHWARAQDIDTGMQLGVSHPRGPLAWCELIGARHVVGVLDALHRETGEPRYRVAPALRRRAAKDLR